MEPCYSSLLKDYLGTIEIGPIEWWLEWILEELDNKEVGFWLNDRLSNLFANYLKSEVRALFIDEFNRNDSPYRGILTKIVLPKFDDLTIDQFSEDTISYLLNDLTKKQNQDRYREDLLSKVVSEDFVLSRLLPLLPYADEPFRTNLIFVLQNAGRRHGRRYVAS